MKLLFILLLLLTLPLKTLISDETSTKKKQLTIGKDENSSGYDCEYLTNSPKQITETVKVLASINIQKYCIGTVKCKKEGFYDIVDLVVCKTIDGKCPAENDCYNQKSKEVIVRDQSEPLPKVLDKIEKTFTTEKNVGGIIVKKEWDCDYRKNLPIINAIKTEKGMVKLCIGEIQCKSENETKNTLIMCQPDKNACPAANDCFLDQGLEHLDLINIDKKKILPPTLEKNTSYRNRSGQAPLNHQ